VRPAGSGADLFRCRRQAPAGRRGVAPYHGRTGLHWTIPGRQLEVIRLLLARGADPSIRDEMFHADADAMLHVYFATEWHDPVTQQLHDLLESRSR
jgi:hypothetical protein